MNTPTRIVVTGGSGFVGTATLRHLHAAFPQARLIVPTRADAAPAAPGIEWVTGSDVHEPAQAARLLHGADALVHLVAILHGSPAQFERVHVQLVRTWADAARTAGVARVVHVSALGVAANAPSHYLRSKAAGEAAWAAAGVPAAMLRPSVIFGAHDRFTHLFRTLLRWAPVLPLARADARFQPVWVEDVAAAIAHLVATPQAGVVDAAGPEVLTLGEIVRSVARQAGWRRAVLPLPEWAGRVQAALLGLLPGEPLMSADNLRSMRVPSVASGGPGLASLGIAPAALAPTARAWLSR